MTKLKTFYLTISPLIWSLCWVGLIFGAVRSESFMISSTLFLIAALGPLLLAVTAECVPAKYRLMIMKILGII